MIPLYIHHDSRVRENSEVGVIYPDKDIFTIKQFIYVYIYIYMWLKDHIMDLVVDCPIEIMHLVRWLSVAMFDSLWGISNGSHDEHMYATYKC